MPNDIYIIAPNGRVRFLRSPGTFKKIYTKLFEKHSCVKEDWVKISGPIFTKGYVYQLRKPLKERLLNLLIRSYCQLGKLRLFFRQEK